MHTTRSPAELRNMLGANLRRLSRSYPSISELARQLGINRTQFNRYLSGESFPRPDVLDRICSFFRVDARILLEPVENLNTRGNVLGGNFLEQFHGAGVNDIPEEEFPSGFYRFSRRSFMNDDRFVIGLVRVFRSDGVTYLRGMEPRDALRQQGLPVNRLAREYRGYVAREEDGVAIMVARVQATTCSFSFLARVPAFERNYWLGYVARTMRESATQRRMTRLVYEHLPNKTSDILAAARSCGFCTAEELVPYHRRLLQIDEPFR